MSLDDMPADKLIERITGPKLERTVKVRIAVAVDESGDWSAVGWRDATDKEAMSSATDFADGETRCYWLTAELELPEASEVKANVENV